MSVTQMQPRVPKSRRDLARQLRDWADIIEADGAETEPNACLMVMTGRTQHEVLWFGGAVEGQFLSGALQAAHAVIRAPFETVGGQIRPRTHQYGSGRKIADVVMLRKEGEMKTSDLAQ
ncbi:MAG: hypothetical protein AAGK79_13260 [Pseudomonadota bacterium]